VKIAVAQTHAAADVGGNKAAAARLIRRAADAGASLVVFPEMSILEFFPRAPHRYDAFALAEEIPGPTLHWFAEHARRHEIAVVYNHYERSAEGVYFDTSVVVARDGSVRGRQRMMHIAEEPGYNEKFYYAPGWDAYHVFELAGWRFGIATCYDRHFPEVFRSFIVQGAQLVLIPTAVAKSEPFGETYELEMRAAAVTHGVYVALANRSGAEPPLEFLGQSMVIDPLGHVVERLDEKPDQIGTVSLDHDLLMRARYLYPFLRDRRPETYGLVSRVPVIGTGESDLQSSR
jgi:N-carbamoylputrescine amidase